MAPCVIFLSFIISETATRTMLIVNRTEKKVSSGQMRSRRKSLHNKLIDSDNRVVIEFGKQKKERQSFDFI